MDDHMELKDMRTRTVIESASSRSSYSYDAALLARLGKRPLLNRSFAFMSILGFSCSALFSWESVLITSLPTLSIAGPSAVFWGFLVNWIGMFSVYAVLAELSSIAPTTGGQYHWVFLLAPKSQAIFLSYLTGWLTTIAWQAITTSVSFATATLLQGVVALAMPSYMPLPWHTVLIMWAASLFSVIMNSITSKTLAKFEGLILILHLFGFFGVLVPMVYYADHNPPSAVFTTFFDEGGWDSNTAAFFIGLPAMASPLIGADCAVHMSEEIQEAAIIVPRALLWTTLINGLLALSMIIALLFSIGDVGSALEATETLFYPFLYVFREAVGNTTGACLLAGITLVLSISAGVGIYASASRMIWSFARDKGLPLHRQLVKLTSASLPVNAIVVTFIVNVLLSLIVLGSAIVLQAFVSLINAALYTSYIIVCGLLLWRRATGSIKPYMPGSETLRDDGLIWGPWKVPEPFGTFNNIFACIYILLIWFWSFWPPIINPSPDLFNWSILVFGVAVSFSVVWYVVQAKHHFKGPIREV
ncbi:amino acid transporter [Nemania serpens]|nr:amino acid transporter [Nemania serpens]